MQTESKVVLFLLFSLVAGEGLAWLTESSLSADVRQMLAFGRIPAEFAEAKAKGRVRVLVIGNSLARASVDEDALEEGLRAKGIPEPLVCFLAPDASGVNEWTAAYRKLFGPSEGGRGPDLVVIPTGPSHLLDHAVRSPEKLGAFHASLRDFPLILSDWLTTTDERSRFLLASVSRLFANRERIRPLLFYRLVPGYEATAGRLNRAGGETAPVQVPERSGGKRLTAGRFDELLDSIGLPGGRILVVAVPLPDPYELPGAVLEVASSRGVKVDQEAALRQWPADAFPDGYHLGKSHAGGFTREVIEAMSADEIAPAGVITSGETPPESD